jgi:hypothetical protein
MYIGVNLIIFEHKLSPQPIPAASYRFELPGQSARGKGTRPSGPESLASPLFSAETPEPPTVTPCSLLFPNPQSLIFSLFSFSSWILATASGQPAGGSAPPLDLLISTRG